MANLNQAWENWRLKEVSTVGLYTFEKACILANRLTKLHKVYITPYKSGAECWGLTNRYDTVIQEINEPIAARFMGEQP